MRKYLGIVSILVLLIACLIYKIFIYGTVVRDMPLFLTAYVFAYVLSAICCWFSYRGIWKVLAAAILIFILIIVGYIFIILAFSSSNFGT